MSVPWSTLNTLKELILLLVFRPQCLAQSLVHRDSFGWEGTAQLGDFRNVTGPLLSDGLLKNRISQMGGA